ncbi:AAA family ATPase [Streptomyces sp. NPDC048266]|uniref:ATP-binding protein n=1 Tax=Streptomyces sp. NPDC048266 TaxID=3155787 RepID=UPI0034057602
MLEREGEIRALSEALNETLQGGGGLLLIEGPVGIGKSHLLAEARSLAGEKGFDVMCARSNELEQDFSFGIVRQLFKRCLATENPAWWQGPAAQAREVLLTAPTQVISTGDFAVLHGLFWLTANCSHNRPLMLIIDDLQWCDVASLRYLAYLLPRIEGLGVLVAVSLRTGEKVVDPQLLQHIIADPTVTVVRPGPLSRTATQELLGQILPSQADPAFSVACHRVSGGNPLLLRELARTLISEGLSPVASHAEKVAAVVPRAVARLMTVRMASIPQSTVDLVEAVAVLGDGAAPAIAAALAGQDITTALRGVATLEHQEILHSSGELGELTFVHPLMQTVIYDGIKPSKRAIEHYHAAILLASTGADLERIAAHLLRTPPAGKEQTVNLLQKAAAQAVRRGSAASAHSYLRRALAEPPQKDQLKEVLNEVARLTFDTDYEAAAGYLELALELSTDPFDRADLSYMYAKTLHFLGRVEESVRVVDKALEDLPEEEDDHRRRLMASLAALSYISKGMAGQNAIAEQLHSLPPTESLGALMANAFLAGSEVASGNSDGTLRAKSLLANNRLISGNPAFNQANFELLWALSTSNPEEGLSAIDFAISEARKRGSVTSLALFYLLRANLGWMNTGDLTEAENDARESLLLLETTNLETPRADANATLALSLIEQGKLDQAGIVLSRSGMPDPPPTVGLWFLLLEARSHFLYARREYVAALEAAQAAGENATGLGFTNPAVSSWRSQVSRCLYAIGRREEARVYAEEEVKLAQRFGATHSLGRALRIAGLVSQSDRSLPLLQEAESLLRGSAARLEHAKALSNLGAALRRSNRRQAARPLLHEALDLATRCEAAPLVAVARSELAAAGGRPRSTAVAGPRALTPSERRVAELAATGSTNREIAQALYVAPKTVEVHLSAVYRKLGIASRTQLHSALLD